MKKDKWYSFLKVYIPTALSVWIIVFVLFILNGCATTKIALTEQEKDDRIKSWRLSNPNPWVILYKE